jgi:RsiW-degrading membrane proteinase PrsW (M82 family)
MSLYLVIVIITSCFIGWIWIDYYRLIKVYDRKNSALIITTFLLGAASGFLITPLHEYLLHYIPISLNGTAATDLVYCVIKVAVPEEFVKILPFTIVFLLFRKHFKQPIDYIAFASFSALGFAAAEDVDYFIGDKNAAIIVGRALLTSVGHMFYTALIAYSIVLIKFKKQKGGLLLLPAFFSLAVFCHATYDCLVFDGGPLLGFLASVLFFMLTVSLFAVILNNCLNNDSEFTYRKYIDSDKVLTRLLIYYAIVYFIQYCINTAEKGPERAILSLEGTVFVTAPILIIVITRLSRFKLIQGRWEKLKLELPFSYTYSPTGEYFRSGFIVKGEPFAETSLNKLYQEYFTINPVSKNSFIEKSREVFIEKKYFLENDKAFHIIKLFTDKEHQHFEWYALSTKLKGKTRFNDKYRIVALFKFKDSARIDAESLSVKDFKFIEWVYIKPIKIGSPEENKSS